MTVTVLIGHVTEVTDKIDAHQSRGAGPYRVKSSPVSERVSTRRDELFVVFPLTVIFLYHFRKHFLKSGGPISVLPIVNLLFCSI